MFYFLYLKNFLPIQIINFIMMFFLHIIISKVMLRYASFDIIYPAIEIQQFNNASDYIT